MKNRGRGGKDKEITMEHRIILGNKFFKIRNKHIILKIIYIYHYLRIVSNSSSKVCPFIYIYIYNPTIFVKSVSQHIYRSVLTWWMMEKVHENIVTSFMLFPI